MLKRLANTGLNVGVLLIAVAVFIVSFLALTALGAAQKPPTLTILAAGRDLSIGDVLTPADIVQKTVFKDDNADLYILADQPETLVGGVVLLPISAGSPIQRDAVMAEAGEAYRLSAALADYPDHSLVPLLLDANNVVAPDATSFLPGDLVNVTVVIDRRPEQPTTPTPYVPGAIIQFTPVPVNGEPIEAAKQDAIDKTMPPLAKDLFPEGVRVIAIQGLPIKTVQSEDQQDSSSSDANMQSLASDVNQHKLLVLLIPNASRELLSLALKQGDLLVVSLLPKSGDTTAGFTYWDFEEWFKADREEILKQAPKTPVSPQVTPTLPVTATATTTP
jgi:Flp pilus assembly protein CpaB